MTVAWAPQPAAIARVSEAMRQMDMLVAETGQPTAFGFFAHIGGFWRPVELAEAQRLAAAGVSVELRLRIVSDRERAAVAQEVELKAERERRKAAGKPREIAAGLPRAGEFYAVGELP